MFSCCFLHLSQAHLSPNHIDITDSTRSRGLNSRSRHSPAARWLERLLSVGCVAQRVAWLWLAAHRRPRQGSILAVFHSGAAARWQRTGTCVAVNPPWLRCLEGERSLRRAGAPYSYLLSPAITQEMCRLTPVGATQRELTACVVPWMGTPHSMWQSDSRRRWCRVRDRCSLQVTTHVTP